MADTEEAPSINIGAAISEKLTESIQNMDILNTLQNMVAQTPEDEESQGIQDKLRGVLEQFRGMTPEEKADFTAKVKSGLADKLSMKLKDGQMLEGVQEAIRNAIMTKLYMVAAGFLLLMFLLIFFGYKLFKSLKEREKKREEKKKAKQLKKKK